MKKILSLLSLSLFLGPQTPIAANVLVHIPIQEQFNRSHATIIAEVTRNGTCEVNGQHRKCVILRNVVVLSKRAASPDQQITQVVIENGISESRVRCCKIGETYLMFVVTDGESYFLYLDGRSIFRLESH